MAKTKLTSIKLLEDVYKKFKITALQNGETLQRVVNRSIFLYTNDLEFRRLLEGSTQLECSGSNF